MKLYNYNFELRSVLNQVLDVFNNISIKRFDDPTGSSGTTKLVTVPCVYGSRSALLKNLDNKDKTVPLPIMTIVMTNLNRNASRAHSVNALLEFQTSSTKNVIHNVATPVDLSFELTIVTKFRQDLAQIISNFVAIFNPDIYVVWPNPKGQGNLKTQIVWDGDCSIETPDEASETEPERMIATATFTAKTWIFPGSGAYDDSAAPKIKKINFNNSYGVGPDPQGINGLTGDGFGLSGGYFAPENAFNKWWNLNDYTMSLDEFTQNILSGYVQYPNYDYLPIVDDLSGSYWLNNVYGVLSGDLYAFNNNSDLEVLIANETNPDLELTLLFDDGYYYGLGTFFQPQDLQTSGNWGSIWRRMLSGDLAPVTKETSATSNWQYLIKENSYLYLLYEDFTVIPIIT